MASNLEGAPNALFAGVFSRGAVARQLSARAWLEALLEVEAGLARAAARAGLVSAEAAALVEQAAQVDGFELTQLCAPDADTGNPVPALVRALTARVPEHARGAVHVGATSQDILDTALMLLAKRASGTLCADLAAAADRAAELADRHRADVMLGRTLMQPALPITFGLKASGWLTALDQSCSRFHGLAETSTVVQFGGAAGTLAALGTRGPQVARLLAEELGLVEPAVPWHTLRLPLLDWATAAALCGTVLGKIARDVSLMSQFEVGEVREGNTGRGGSSSMPHKHNQVATVAVLACTRRLPGLVATLLAAAEQEHERGAGGWHAEWEVFSDLMRLVGSAASWTRELLGELEVDTRRMRLNYEATLGQTLTERLRTVLEPTLGRLEAHAFVRAASERSTERQHHLEEILLHDPAFAGRLREAGVTPAQLSALFDPAGYLGSCETWIERALSGHTGIRAGGTDGRR